MSDKKPYYRHCNNCVWCFRSATYEVVCEVKHIKRHKGRLRALFCRFFKQEV